MTEEQRESSFDALAKGLASGTVSRGKALRLMGAALVGGTLASVPGIASAVPKPRPNGRKCKTNSQCVSENCAGGVCQAGGCPSGTTACGTGCVTNCTSPEVLDPSTCTCGGCPTGLTLCNEQCRNTASDNAYCGSCTNACSEVQTCQNGQCVDITYTTCGSIQCPDDFCTNAGVAGCNGSLTRCLQTPGGGQACVANCSTGKTCTAENPNTCGTGETCVNTAFSGDPTFECRSTCNG